MNARALLAAAVAVVLLASCAGPSAERKKEAAARMSMGVTYLEQNNLPSAMKQLSRASELDPSNPEVDMVLGLAYRARGDMGMAEKYFRSAIDKKPDYADAHNNLGVLLGSLGRGDEAIREFEAAAANIMYATPEIASYNMGEEFRRQGKKEKGEAAYRRAIELNDRYGPAYRGLALLQASGKRPRDAAKTLEKCVSLVPGYAPAWLDLGRPDIRLNRKKDALEAFRNVLANTEEPALRREASESINLLGAGTR